MPTDDLVLNLVHVPHITKATAAQKLLCAVGDWPESNGSKRAVLAAARTLTFHGYTDFALKFDDTRGAYLVLGVTEPNGGGVAELHLLPGMHGHRAPDSQATVCISGRSRADSLA
jgi:hypothetical protein